MKPSTEYNIAISDAIHGFIMEVAIPAFVGMTKKLTLRNSINIVVLVVVFIFTTSPAIAKEIPYYATIKSDEANIRTGPNVRYPIQWTYKRKNWPVQVTATFERWRKISDIYGEIGWIHENLLSNNRYALIKANGFQEIYRLPLNTSSKVFIAENSVIVDIKECKNLWCKIRVEGHEGWVKQENLWGINKAEAIE